MVEIESLLQGRVKKLYRIWTQYYHMSVYKNEHLSPLLFLFVLGTYLTNKGVKNLLAGAYKSLRIHIFIIQSSGSGKSEAMKAVYYLCKFIGLDAAYTTKTTDAALIGTISRDKDGEIFERKGELSYRDCYTWDEGSILMKSGPHSENLQDILQIATDEPGYIEKAMAHGVLKYYTHTSICAGSYLEEGINVAMLKRGCFQRMLLAYSTVSFTDVKEFLGNSNYMFGVSYSERRNLMEEFKRELESIDFDKLNKSNAEHAKVYVKFNMNDTYEISKKTVDFANYAEKAFKLDDRRMDIIKTFIARNKQIFQVAAICAAVNEKHEVTMEDLEVGLHLWEEHIKAANNIMMLKSELITMNDYFKRLQFTKNILGQSSLSKEELIQKLIGLGTWDLGRNNTIKFLNESVEKGDLFSESRVKTTGGKVVFINAKS